MLTKQLLLLLLATVLATMLYFQAYFVGHFQPDQSARRGQTELASPEPTAAELLSKSLTETTVHQAVPAPAPNILEESSNHYKRIEIFGRVVDEYNNPVESVLVSEDRNFYSTRSDLNGQYRLTIGFPKHKLPLLNFLRAGYRANRIGISVEDLDNDSAVELNVTLIESSESVQVGGWIGNEIGESLPGQKIRIASRGYFGFQEQESIYHIAVSDEHGEFVFEAVKPDIEYKLDVYTTPEYAPYSIEALTVTRTSPRLNISLKPLRFIPISGMFIDSEGAPLPNFEIDIRNLSTGTHVRKIVSDSSGFFNLVNFPAGEIEFSSREPEFFKITGLTLAENEYRHLELVVDKGNYQLSGWVSDQYGVAIDKAKVTLNAAIMRNGVSSISIRTAVTNYTGRFQFDQLGDVEHTITIYSRGFDKKEQLHRFQSLASEVHISLSRQ
jgi:hypothetical protein